MHFDDRQKLYNEIYEQKKAYAYKNKQIHIPRYWLVVIWGLFMTLIVYVYAVESLNELNQANDSIENIKMVQKPQKVRATIEFIPNATEPRFVGMPSL